MDDRMPVSGAAQPGAAPQEPRQDGQGQGAGAAPAARRVRDVARAVATGAAQGAAEGATDVVTVVGRIARFCLRLAVRLFPFALLVWLVAGIYHFGGGKTPAWMHADVAARFWIWWHDFAVKFWAGVQKLKGGG